MRAEVDSPRHLHASCTSQSIRSRMLGFIVFAAILHIALGYGIAVYLGYAPTGRIDTCVAPNVAPTRFEPLVDEDDIVIADHAPTVAPATESSHPTVFVELDAVGSQLAPDAAVNLDVIAEPSTAETALPMDMNDQSPATSASSEKEKSLAIDELRALSGRIRYLLVECVDLLSNSSHSDGASNLEPVSALASASGAIGQELSAVAPFPSSNDPLSLRVTAIWEHFVQQMSTYLDSTGANLPDTADGLEVYQASWLSALEATFHLSDDLAVVQFELAQRGSWLTDIEENTLADEETGLASTVGIVRAYNDYKSSSATDLKLVVALLDIDHCRKLNKSLGPVACDELIVRVTELIRTTLGNAVHLGRFSGQRFAVLIPGLLQNAATDEIERVRETLRATTFRVNGVAHRASMTCALSEAASSEPIDQLMKRLNDTLAEAKRYGRDRTFLHEGQFPVPVVPSKVEISPQTIELNASRVPA